MPANEVQVRRNAWKNLSLEDLDVLPFNPVSSYRRGGIPAMVGDAVDYALPDLPSRDTVMNIAQGAYDMGEALYRGPNFTYGVAPKAPSNLTMYGIPKHGPPSYASFHAPAPQRQPIPAPVLTPPRKFDIVENLPPVTEWGAVSNPGSQQLPHAQMHGASIVDMADLNPNDVLDFDHEMWANDRDRAYENRKLEAKIADQERILKWRAAGTDPSNPIQARQLDAEVLSMNNAIKQQELVNAHYGEREKVLAALNADRYGAEQRANAEIAAASMKGGQSGPTPDDIADALIKSGVPPQVAMSNATVMAGLESAAVAKMFEDLVSRHNKEMDPADIASLANALTAAYNPAMGQRSDEEVMAFNRMRGNLGNFMSQTMNPELMKQIMAGLAAVDSED